MARPRKKGSTIPYMGLGLEKAEEHKLQQIIKRKGLSGKSILRTLVKEFIKAES